MWSWCCGCSENALSKPHSCSREAGMFQASPQSVCTSVAERETAGEGKKPQQGKKKGQFLFFPFSGVTIINSAEASVLPSVCRILRLKKNQSSPRARGAELLLSRERSSRHKNSTGAVLQGHFWVPLRVVTPAGSGSPCSTPKPLTEAGP